MAANRPYVSAAFLCERVLQEKDNVLSAIRIVDTFYVVVPKNLPPEAKPQIVMTALVSLQKSAPGPAENHQVEVQLTSPSGEQFPRSSIQMTIPEGDIGGANAVINVTVVVKEFGRFVLELTVDGDVRTCMPFRLLERSADPPPALH